MCAFTDASSGCSSLSARPAARAQRLRLLLKPGASVLVVAYRKATIALADTVVHLEDGRVVDQGTHAELLRRSPGYAHLVNAYEAGHPDHLEQNAAAASSSTDEEVAR